jgi:exodeoxyribonuclease VII large subunit
MATMLTNDILSGGINRDILSVSQLNRRAKQLLETHLPLLWVEGELSNVSQPSSGHWYFTLKDAQAQVRCAMFRNRNQLVRFIPQQGQQVLIRARVSLYEGRGDYQLIAEHMEESGAGALQRAFDELKLKLAAEGLFEQSCKQPLPPLPSHIAVITSPTGAAVRDILSVLKRRFPAIPVTVIPVAVQGKEAAPQIVKAIEQANRSGLFDVLVVGRGGGSLEDLWPFNEEIVARAIFASALPVVSAVGHEVDFTIADFVADLRAPTPSAAAELLVPDVNEWLQTFSGYEVLLEQAMGRKLRAARQQLHWLTTRLRHPGSALQQQAQRLDGLELRLVRAVDHQLLAKHTQLNTLILRQRPLQPQQRLMQLNQQVELLAEQLLKNTRRQLQQQQQRLGAAVRVLQTVSPLNTLERGYAITTNSQQQLITRSTQATPGEIINTRLAHGELVCRVEKVIS